MTRDEFMAHAKAEIESALGSTKNRLMNLVEQAWAEGKRNSEVEQLTSLMGDVLAAMREKKGGDDNA